MKVLIVTQAVDNTDPVLGFFHRWIEEFASRASSIEIICLKKGNYTLPHNVHIHSLGKEEGAPHIARRLIYAFRFWLLAWSLRRKYDAVFVHMNEEYVIIFGFFWRALGKKIVLWRNYKTGSWMTPIAACLVDTVCYTSPDSYTTRFSNALRMPVGIDTNHFAPESSPQPAPHSLLFFGRLDPVKRPDVFLAALELLSKRGVVYDAHIYGDPTPGHETYAENLKLRYAHLSHVSFHSGVTNREAPALYQHHAIYVNLTPSGSFDKTIGEAMASGCIAVVSNAAVSSVIPAPLFIHSETAKETSRAISEALALPTIEHARVISAQRAYIVEEHSLALLAERLFEKFETQSKKIHILFGLNDLGIGGAEHMTVEIIKKMDSKKFECTVITLFERSGPNLISKLPHSVQVHEFKFSGFTDLWSWIQLYRYLSSTKPDIVVSSLFFSNTIFRVLKPLVGYVSISREHNTYIDKPLWQRITDRLLAPLSYRIVAVSKTVADFTARQEDIPRTHFSIIHNGIDMDKTDSAISALPEVTILKKDLGLPVSGKILLNIARLTPQKGHSALLEGFSLFHSAHKEYALLIVGEGTERKRLEQKALELGLLNAVYFFGYRDDVWKFYKIADFFVSTSVIEGMSNAYLEALSAGVPVVATLTAGTDELLENGVNGFVLDEASPQAINSALSRAIISNRTELSANAKKTAQQFSLDRSVRSYESLFISATTAGMRQN